ncbi:MAG: PorT family protein [Tannerellaceae bacterium]|jgi:hypothetical protein|nr:PorT family protein [Tannerellaceae bacterium]
MKKILGFIGVVIMAFTAVSAHAQIRFGVKGGANISTVRFSKEIANADNVTGFHIGPMIEAMVPYVGLGIDAAILYSQKGVYVVADGRSRSLNNDFIEIPVNVKWKFGIPIIKAYLAAGPYVDFCVSGDKLWEMPSNVKSQFETKTFSAGVNLGAGVELLKHLQVGFYYSLGLTNNYSIKKVDLAKAGKDRTWVISAAFLF